MVPLRFDFTASGIVKLHVWCGPARIRLTVAHRRKIWRKPCSETCPEDRDDDVAPRRFRNLRLKGVVSAIELAFPSNGGELRYALKLTVEPFDNPFQPAAFKSRIDR